MKIEKSARTNTITLSSAQGVAIQPYFVRNIFFGNSMTDLNLCSNNGTANGTAQFYKMAAVPDLTK
jgi:hypothetical protein